MGRGLFTEFHQSDKIVDLLSQKKGIIAVKGGCRFNIASLMTNYSYQYPLTSPINTIIHYLYWSIYHLNKWEKLEKEGRTYTLPTEVDFQKIANDVRFIN
jgi:hypothetical protein